MFPKKEIKAGTMEDYVYKLITETEKELAECIKHGNTYPNKERFFALSSRKDVLFMIITGHNNPLANPK